LSWNSVAGATSYRLQVSTSISFATIVLDDSTNAGSSRQVGPLANSTIYYWRVNAKNAGGTSAFSSVWNFTTTSGLPAPPSTPTLSSPANAATNQPTTVTLSWNPSSGATRYH